jgi:hypothetical protein
MKTPISRAFPWGFPQLPTELRERHYLHLDRRAWDQYFSYRNVSPRGTRKIAEDRITNLRSMLDSFVSATGYHKNVINRETLLDSMDHPEKYPHLTMRVSGYAVKLVRLTRENRWM